MALLDHAQERAHDDPGALGLHRSAAMGDRAATPLRTAVEQASGEADAGEPLARLACTSRVSAA